MMLRQDDFTPVNFGILMAKFAGHEFIYQQPSPYDKERAAQDNDILFINRKKQDVKDFDDALKISNNFLNNL